MKTRHGDGSVAATTVMSATPLRIGRFIVALVWRVTRRVALAHGGTFCCPCPTSGSGEIRHDDVRGIIKKRTYVH